MSLLIRIYLAFFAYFLIFNSPQAWGQVFLDLESGLVFSGYNNVRVPNKTGTTFSLTTDLKTDFNGYFRIRTGYILFKRHVFTLLAAPLRLYGSGVLKKSVSFNEVVFPENSLVSARYRFDSYRLTYRYDFYWSKGLQIGAGLTAKLRSASISVKGSGQETEKVDLGFVPLINFRLYWAFADPFSLLFEFDALVGPQGRAEDVSLAFQYAPAEVIHFRVGYRFVEGGANVGSVYNFTMIHYLAFGAFIRFW